MPIKGMTDGGPRLYRLGTLRKGAAKTANKPGKNLDHFRFDPTDGNEEAADAFNAAYPNGNDVIVYLPYRSINDNWMAFREEYTNAELVHRCDGSRLWEYDEAGRLSETNIPCPYADRDNKGCKPVGRLQVLIPALMEAGYVGTVTVTTTSINDIVNLSAALEAYAEAGALSGVPFVLSRQEQMISKPINGKRVRSAEWLIVLRPANDWVLRRQIEAANQPTLSLAAPGDNTMDIVFENDSVVEGDVILEDGRGVCSVADCGAIVSAEAVEALRAKVGRIYCKEHYKELVASAS